MAERSIGDRSSLCCRSLSSSACRPEGRAGVTRRTLGASLAAALLPVAWAQERFPSRSIRMIVPYPAGAATDTLARALAQKLGSNLGVAVVVENRGGASGTIGTEQLAKSAPDGYTIGIAVPSTHSLPVALGRKVPYDPLQDFTPLGIMVSNPLAIVVTNDVPVTGLRELVEHARRNPGKLAYASSGGGTSQHLAAEMLSQFAGIHMIHVPYKGGTNSLADLLSGQIQVGFVAIPSVLQHVKAGKLRMLAVIDDKRSPELPDVPTCAEALPGFAPRASWIGMFGPARLPPAVSARLGAELRRALHDPEVTRYLSANGMPVVAGTGEEFAARLREDIETWGPIVRAARITASD